MTSENDNKKCRQGSIEKSDVKKRRHGVKNDVKKCRQYRVLGIFPDKLYLYIQMRILPRTLENVRVDVKKCRQRRHFRRPSLIKRKNKR